MSAPVSHEIMRPLNSMICVPGLIGSAANNPTPLIADLRFCHSRFSRCSLIPSSHSFTQHTLSGIGATMLACPITLSFAAPRPDRCKPARNGLRFCDLVLQPLHQSVKT